MVGLLLPTASVGSSQVTTGLVITPALMASALSPVIKWEILGNQATPISPLLMPS